MLSAFLDITDDNWFDYLRRNQITEQVHFWTPSALARRLIDLGTLWLLKLHGALDFIAGASVLMRESVLPLQIVWDALGVQSGMAAFDNFRSGLSLPMNR